MKFPRYSVCGPFGKSEVAVALEPGRTVISPGPAGEAARSNPRAGESHFLRGELGTIVVEKGKDGRGPGRDCE